MAAAVWRRCFPSCVDFSGRALHHLIVFIRDRRGVLKGLQRAATYACAPLTETIILQPPREKRRSSSQQPRDNNKIVVLAVHVRSLVGQTSTPHVACAPPTAHTAHRAYSDIAIVKIKLDSKATASKICVPSHNRWMIRCTNLDLAGSRTPLSIARRILGSLVMLFEAQHGKYSGGEEHSQCAWTPL